MVPSLSIIGSMSPAVRISLTIVLAYVLVALFAPLLAPYGETMVVGRPFEPWSADHWFGTDSVGRDMLSRLIYGARNMIVIALGINILTFLLGGFLGMLAALKGGWIDQVIGRVTDAAMAVPQLIFALLIIAIVGTSVPALVATIVVLDSTRVIRFTRAVSMNVAAMDYMEVAHLRGEGVFWCMYREVLPNIRVPMISEFGMRFCFVFLFISSLSFLGIGLQPPAADWGSMVRETSSLIAFGDLTPLVPAVAIAVLTISVNFMTDWLLSLSSKAKI